MHDNGFDLLSYDSAQSASLLPTFGRNAVRIFTPVLNMQSFFPTVR